MNKEAFKLLLTIIASVPILSASFYTYHNFTLYNAMYLIGASIEFLAVAIALLMDDFDNIFTNILNRKEVIKWN